MSPSTKTLRVLFLLVSMTAALPATAQTILLAVGESANGAPVAPPLPAREGVAGSLFDSGFVVFDLPGGGVPRAPAEMIGVARAAGADFVLVVRVQYADSSLGAGALLISAGATFTLTDAASGVVTAKGEASASNEKREKNVDREALGREIGAAVAARVRDALAPGPR